MSEYIVKCKEFIGISGATMQFPEYIDMTQEIVRCRDCVKWDYDSTYPKKACYEFSNPEDGYIIATSPDGFCAWAERKESGDD